MGAKGLRIWRSLMSRCVPIFLSCSVFIACPGSHEMACKTSHISMFARHAAHFPRTCTAAHSTSSLGIVLWLFENFPFSLLLSRSCIPHLSLLLNYFFFAVVVLQRSHIPLLSLLLSRYCIPILRKKFSALTIDYL